jgi:hypothetical protein
MGNGSAFVKGVGGHPGRSAARSGALQTRDRHKCQRLERSRLSSAPLRNSFALHRSQDTGPVSPNLARTVGYR